MIGSKVGLLPRVHYTYNTHYSTYRPLT